MDVPQRYFLNVEHSATGQAWVDGLDGITNNHALAVAQKFGLPEPLARVLSARGVDDTTIDHYLNPTLRELMPDPLKLKDMAKASQRLVEAIRQRENVAIFGDYDVDGACSTALLAQFLRSFNIKTELYIPDRIHEGYGPNARAMQTLVQNGATLIVTVDCGSNSREAIAAASDAGADVVVLDHHPTEVIDDQAYALVNPNRADDLSGQGHLCAAGVTFITIAQVCRDLKEKHGVKNLPDLLGCLDLVALATVCDVVPLIGVNRAFVTKGLQVARKMHNHGLSALIQSAKIGEPLNCFHLGYLLGPRINAGGRIGDQGLGARLLLSRDQIEAGTIADQLTLLNHERQNLEAEQLSQAEAILIQSFADDALPPVLVVASPDWHPGIVGLLASRLKERYQRPAFALAIKADGMATGSGRSIAAFDLGSAVQEAVRCQLIEKGGGHAMAAGVSIQAQQIAPFREWICAQAALQLAKTPRRNILKIDGALSASGANAELYQLLEQAGPYGCGNTPPLFVVVAHTLTDLREVGKGHLSLTVKNFEGHRLKAIAFGASNGPLGTFLHAHLGRPIHLAGNLQLNYWNGRATPQLRVVDAAS